MENKRLVFVEFVTNSKQRVLIDFYDIRGVIEGNSDTDKGYCKIFFHSNVNAFQWIELDYDSVINKINAVMQSLNS